RLDTVFSNYLPPPSATLFPYTTLFRSWLTRQAHADTAHSAARTDHSSTGGRRGSGHGPFRSAISPAGPPYASAGKTRPCPLFARSEEHTSELQSPYDLVCRLLLEKKK